MFIYLACLKKLAQLVNFLMYEIKAVWDRRNIFSFYKIKKEIVNETRPNCSYDEVGWITED